MKKLLISSLAVLAMATSSLTLAATSSNGTEMNGMNSTTKVGYAATGKPTETMGTEKIVVRVKSGSTNAENRPIRVSEVTLNGKRATSEKSFAAKPDAIVKVAEARCENTNLAEFAATNKRVSEVLVDVQHGKCVSATFK